MGVFVPRVTLTAEPAVETYNINIDMEELLKINREKTWALSREELSAIKEYFNRPATIEERKKAGLGERAHRCGNRGPGADLVRALQT